MGIVRDAGRADFAFDMLSDIVQAQDIKIDEVVGYKNAHIKF